MRGTFSMAFSVWLNPPPDDVPEAMPSTLDARACGFGWLVTNLIVPPIEPAPYSVPCGPRSTSTRLRSKRLGSITVLPFWAIAAGVRTASSR
jgi:hypothetical protein